MSNPTFKAPATPAPQRNRSPIRPQAEPLSPPPPSPIEPNFNYPPLDNAPYNAAALQQAFAATPKARQDDAMQNGHHHTPSTIDTLADAALAFSPDYPAHSRDSLAAKGHFGQPHGHAHPAFPPYTASEPPHKRARSELLPSPHVASYASRPATSYEPTDAWSQGLHHAATREAPGHAYDSRVEEAALLLNFRTGGLPASGHPVLPPPSSLTTTRPHANSFPRDVSHALAPVLLPAAAPSQPSLLPPFQVEQARDRPVTLPSPQQTSEDSGPSPKVQNSEPAADQDGDLQMKDESRQTPKPDEQEEDEAAPQQTQTPPEDEATPRETSTDVTMSEPPSEAPKRKGGWPKGKPRGPSGRKSRSAGSTKKRSSDTATSAKKHKSRPLDDYTREWAAKSELNALKRRNSMGDILGLDDQSESSLRPSTRARSVPREVSMAIRLVSPSKAARRAMTVTSDTVCAGCSSSREGNGELDEWINCNGCKKWLHIDCAGFRNAHEVRDVDKYFCSECETRSEGGLKTTWVRKSTRAHAAVDYASLQQGVLKTSDDNHEHHYIQPIKDGTFKFDPETFPRIRPELVTQELFERSNAFTEPLCIPAAWNPRPWAKSSKAEAAHPEASFGDVEVEVEVEAEDQLMVEDFEYESVPDDGQDKLEMVMPQGLTVRQVCDLVGPDYTLDVIDVKTQNSGGKYTLKRWADYYEKDGDKPIQNVISLEVSATKLGRLLRRPKIVRQIDLQDQVWPQEERDKGKWPNVQFYCLMSIADSYTDFHIDFGGSSVYYHILRGKKTFFFIPPKAKHLKAYEEWNESPQQNFTFLPSITKECYRVDLSEGDTMLIPSGWIHAVWTPETSLVVGGNFLTRMHYPMQFKVVDIEKNNGTAIKFRYPHFQRLMWYTTIQYLEHDPLPPEVAQTFYEGKRFERRTPVYHDSDGTAADADPRPGAFNTRYYSQAEIDGLPDLVAFIFRTAMIVLGRIDGMSDDKRKRVNASIPKSHGEPLEIAKTFALWVAWKRGNEDPPAWAHPDAVLPNSRDDGKPKKLSAKALKELQRQEAIAAWRLAPDRQSERHLTRANIAATVARSSNSPPPSPIAVALSPAPAPVMASMMRHTPPAPAAMMANPAHIVPGGHTSTPKTSVLGPKRVACDACRKRRIRCKHKDDVILTADLTPPPAGLPPPGFNAAAPSFASGQYQPVEYDSVTVTPPRLRPDPDAGFVSTMMDGARDAPRADGVPNGAAVANTPGAANGHYGPLPGTNAYINANVPMTMNGVPLFGEVAKRGRTKACYECRKSKRRCIHNESGEVDPIKAAEPPVPRGSFASKKRRMTEGAEDAAPLAKKPKPELDGLPTTPYSAPQPRARADIEPEMHHPQSMGPAFQPNMISPTQHQPHQPHQPPEQRQHHEQHHQQPQIDPGLFSLYPDPQEQSSNAVNGLPYHNMNSHDPYNLPSLEQIANEVLDMNGRGHEYDPGYNEPPPEEQFVHEQYLRSDGPMENGADAAPLLHELEKNNEVIDSAVSLPVAEVTAPNLPQVQYQKATQKEQPSAPPVLLNGVDQQPAAAESKAPVPEVKPRQDLPPAQSLVVASTEDAPPSSTVTAAPISSPELSRIIMSNIPLYQPPPPPSSSGSVRRPSSSHDARPFTANGIRRLSKTPAPPTDAHAHAPPTSPSTNKRKRDSTSATPGQSGAKKAKGNGVVVEQATNAMSPQKLEEEEENIRLATLLQQQDLGLRRRSKPAMY